MGLKQRLGVHISNQFPGSMAAAVVRTVFFSIGPHTDRVLLTNKEKKKGKQSVMVVHAFNPSLETEAGGTLSSRPAKCEF